MPGYFIGETLYFIPLNKHEVKHSIYWIKKKFWGQPKTTFIGADGKIFLVTVTLQSTKWGHKIRQQHTQKKMSPKTKMVLHKEILQTCQSITRRPHLPCKYTESMYLKYTKNTETFHRIKSPVLFRIFSKK